MIYSLDLERAALGSLIKNPEIYFEVAQMSTEVDFYNKNHQTIFSVIKNTLLKQEKIDKILIAERIKNLGIKFSGDVGIGDYLDDISFAPSTPAQAIKYFKELSLLRVRREIHEIGAEIQKSVKAGEFASFNDIISKTDAIYNQTIKHYTDVDAPSNIFEDLFEVVEERGNNPVQDYGFLTPFNEFNRLYGGLRPKNLYAIASRAGGAKSTFLMNLAFGCHKIDPTINILYLDTEMGKSDQQIRAASAISGVPFWHLDTGNFRRSKEYIDKVRNSLPNTKKYKFYHYEVANKGIDEITSIIRRWFFSKVGRGQKSLIVYDYLKMTGEKLSQNFGETQLMGEKVDKLKKIAEEINAPILTAIQMNRSGESANRNSANLIEDSSTFALTDRLQWFASYTGIFRPKTLDEISSEGAQFGSHKLISLKSRFQGKDAKGFSNFVKRKMPDGAERYVSNFINFNVENFLVEERGTLQDIIDRQDHEYQFNEDKDKPEKLL